MPLYNKIRALKRKLDNAESIIDMQQKRLRKYESKTRKEVTTNQDTASLKTPRKDATQFLRAQNISPTKFPILTKEITALNTLSQHVACAPKKLKLQLLRRKEGDKKKRLASYLSKKVNLNRRAIFSSSRTSKARRMQIAREKLNVVAFLRNPDNSTPLPGKKDQLSKGKLKYSLNDTIGNLHKKYLHENPASHISKATFARQRPPNFKLIQWANRRQCLCIRHQNAALKLKAIRKTESITTFLNKHDEQAIHKMLEDFSFDHVIYKEWRNTEIKYKDTVVNKMRLTELQANKMQFIHIFEEEFESLREHVRRIGTQYSELRNLRNSLEPIDRKSVV